jgi:hypothetical protein
MIVFELFLYVIAGILIDICYTIWYAGVAKENVISSASGSFLVTMVSWTILRFLILDPSFWFQLIAYAIGGAIGTAGTVWYKKKRSTLNK